MFSPPPSSTRPPKGNLGWFFSCVSKTFHQKCLLRYIAERVTRITDNKDRADELYTTESAVVRQSEQTAFLVADDNGIAGNGYGLDMTLHLSLKRFQRILNVNDLRLAAGLFCELLSSSHLPRLPPGRLRETLGGFLRVLAHSSEFFLLRKANDFQRARHRLLF